MTNKIKSLLKKNKRLLAFLVIVYKYKRKYKSLWKTFTFTITGLFKGYIPKLTDDRGLQTKKLFQKVKIKVKDETFVYSIDPLKTLYSENYSIENTTIDYCYVLNHSLEDMKKQNHQMNDCEYKTNQRELLEGIEILLEKEIQAVKKSSIQNKENILLWLGNIKKTKATSFAEALQRILFYNQLLWQTGHPLNGLGRLDKILGDLYEKEKKLKKLNKQETKAFLSAFLKILHEYYWVKSNSLLGDTGQIIILGGKEEDERYFCNDLTYFFIEELEKLQLPDPKILLRVSKKIPKNLMELSVRCIQTGIGCPLFSNDDVIIPKLMDFGYQKKDAYNYVTSACWEPLIAGKSFDQNNMKTLVFIQPFHNMLEKENLGKIKNTQELLEKYKKYLTMYLSDFFKQLDKRKYEKDPLISLFMPCCNQKKCDIADGGATYNHYGATSVSLANTVNSILNIEKYVFKEKKYTLKKFNQIRKDNFQGQEDLLQQLKEQKKRYGIDEKEVIDLTNLIISWVNEILKEKVNRFGGKLKFGLSAPTYIDESKNVEASFDGRKYGDAFIVHISSDVSSLPYTELISFASQLDYTKNAFNGNVIDFMVTPDFIKNNFEKFTDFLLLSIDVGFFQMQMNVIGSETLLRAKDHPEEFPNLIVRVWGFSAYFNDLPLEYKNVLIERALKNEGKSY